jgi:hypothetical protein
MAENKLVDAFLVHEKSFSMNSLSPVDARLGRWIMIYSVLQILATLSVDIDGLRYPAKTAYYTNPPLSGLPPWQHRQNAGGGGAGPAETYRTALMREADVRRSYCWLAPARWAARAAAAGRAGAAGSSDASDATLTPPAYETPPLGAQTSHPASLAELDRSDAMMAGGSSSLLRHAFSAQSLGEMDAARAQQLLRARSVRSAASGSPSILAPIADDDVGAGPPVPVPELPTSPLLPMLPTSPLSATAPMSPSSSSGSGPPVPRQLGPAFGSGSNGPLSPPLLPAMPTLPGGYATARSVAAASASAAAAAAAASSIGLGLQSSPPSAPANKVVIRPQQPTPPPAGAAPGRPRAGSALGVSPNFDADEQRRPPHQGQGQGQGAGHPVGGLPPPPIPEIPRRNPHRALTVGKGQARSRGVSVDHGPGKGVVPGGGAAQRVAQYGAGGR